MDCGLKLKHFSLLISLFDFYYVDPMRIRNNDGKSFSNDKENQFRGSASSRGSRNGSGRGNYQHQGLRSGATR